MKTLLVIGIGAGHPGQLTLQAVDAMRRVDVFFLLDKAGPGNDALTGLRRDLLDRMLPAGHHQLVAAPTPERDTGAPCYQHGIDRWRRARTRTMADLITSNLGEGKTGGFLVWGEPSLYDGTIQALNDLIADGMDLRFDVVPGISSVQALMASHRLPLNRIGEPITITTGRQLAKTDPATVTNTVVMLDSRMAFERFVDTHLDIYWGAYLGTTDEVLVAGQLATVADEIKTVLNRERARKGWVMDTYLLRRPAPLSQDIS